MKISRSCILFSTVSITLFLAYVWWYPSAQLTLDGPGSAAMSGKEMEEISNKDEASYGIMFDAGSTGTRIHIYKFTRGSTDIPQLEHETFKALKPGLSAYADEPDKSAAGINELLDIAKKEIPEFLHRSTPLVLKATAGLRLLPGEKAQKLLDKVTEVFQASPFLIGKDSVSIMNGTDEGIFAWITVNFLTGSLTNPNRKLAGMLDLGGGSTQITFYPYIKETFPNSPAGYITTFQLFNTTYTLYSHSYLGLGLMSARLAIMGGEEGKALKQGEGLVTPCLTPRFVTEFNQAGITYHIRGQDTESSMYEACSVSVSKILKGKVHAAAEVSDLFFYAFSYYYDRAVDTLLIDPELGGSLKVKDFEVTARRECKNMEKTAGENPFLCMDLTYITSLLQELGFPKEKELKLANKINHVETSWALGATFYYMNILKN
ncbi:ectonucleoside triphosphate diphosphohydrolase 6 isoform X1 [Spea bombifrons]|uniref:ectonucleoside triphosphate diphosphohydrolase 6 isoform X1 n=1 Tax=Spea bombifrons TaxID=233779 RepID=UPI0023498236|nr:ectonucleoside triphosphate diphosphohydrolase 6 isoform X1 [Spea bombifrons]XP_053315517.1 ectonucleoside triphosphate diphosphohydrolase 6 isoform X1 [Spea bombifrons]